MIKLLVQPYQKLSQNVRLRLFSKRGHYRCVKEVLAHILTLARRYEAKSFISTHYFSDQNLELLSQGFKTIYLVERRQEPRPEKKKKYPIRLTKHLINGQSKRCFDLDAEDIGRVTQKLHAPAVIRLSQEPALKNQLDDIAQSSQRHAVIIDFELEHTPEKFDQLLELAKTALPGYYFDHDNQRLYCHPF